MEHPFTAHIESPSSGGEWLREGEDYSSSDYEYDSDEEEYLQLAAPSQEVNESLTKKKFCHSAKMFYQIFSSVNQYESFLKFVSKTKKQIFRIIFRLFLEAIPAETRYKLPEELWEKIWKFTQNAHYKYKSQIPICADNNYYKAGFRATNKGVKMQNLEKERLNEMFGTLGNLHMLVFEVLYKNPHLLQPTAQLELEVGGLSDCYSSAVWRECVQVARTSVLRLQQLNNFLPVNKEKTEGSRRKQGDVELSHNLGQGSVHVSDQQLDVDESVLKLGPAASLLVSEFPCPYVCLPGSYNMENDRLGLMVLVIDVENGCKIKHTICTPVRYEHYLIEVGSHRVIRKNESGWKRSFYLTRDRLSFASKMSEPGEEVARVWSVELGGEERVIRLGERLAESVIEAVGGEKPSRNTRAVAVSHSEAGLCLVHQSPYTAFTRVTVHSLTSGETLLSVPFREDVSLLHSGSISRVLLRSQSRCVLLFSLQSGEVVYHWKEADLNKSFNIPQESTWTAVFDITSTKPQICLFTNTMSGFCLNQYDANNEMSRPVVITSGKMSEGIMGLGPCCRLMNGNLISNIKRENLGEFGGSQQIHEISSYYLPRKTKYNIISMGLGSKMEEETLLNINSSKWTDPSEGLFWDPERRPVFAISRSKLGVILEAGRVFRIIDIGKSPAEIINNITQGDEGRKVSETNGIKKDEIKKKKQEISKELAEKDEFHVGTVIDWKGTYGFMKSNGKAKHLGKIFFHINDVQNKQAMKKSLKKGQKLEFKIVYNSCDDSFKTSVSKCIIGDE